MSKLSTFLYARPSFVEGVARAIDLGNTLTEYNQSATPEEADNLALSADWRLIAMDLQNAMLSSRSHVTEVNAVVER